MRGDNPHIWKKGKMRGVKGRWVLIPLPWTLRLIRPIKSPTLVQKLRIKGISKKLENFSGVPPYS